MIPTSAFPWKQGFKVGESGLFSLSPRISVSIVEFHVIKHFMTCSPPDNYVWLFSFSLSASPLRDADERESTRTVRCVTSIVFVLCPRPRANVAGSTRP